MKTTIKNITMLLGATALLLTSCQEKERFVDVSDGEAVQFSIGTKGSELSKAVYAGVESTSGTKKVENIYWKKGDMLRLYSDQAIASYTDDTKHHADYKVLEDTDASKVWAPLIQSDPTDMGLRYKSGVNEYTFYGMHPSPLAGGIGTGITKEGEKIKVTADLKSEQGYDSTTIVNDTLVVVPDLKWMLMTTKKEIKTEEIPADGVALEFTPLTTAVKFTVTNDTESKMSIKKVMLISKGTKADPTPSAISGEFTVDIDDDNEVTASGTPGTEVSIDLSSKNIQLAKEESLTFTFFLAPTKDKIDDLTFRFYKDGSSWMQTRLGYTDGSGIEFPRSKKTIVKGVMLPDGAQWTVKYAPDVDPWGTGGGTPDFKPEFSGDPIVTSWDTSSPVEDLELKDPYNGHEHVEIGDLKWATMNVGATSPKEHGLYFAWGETKGRIAATTDNDAFITKPFNWTNTPFNNSQDGYDETYFSSVKETVCPGGVLAPDYDAAHVNWGGTWHIPTAAEFQALFEACGGTGTEVSSTELPSANPGKGIYWVSAEQIYIADYTGVAGFLFCDGKSKVFFPAAGPGLNANLYYMGTNGTYWSSTLYSSDFSNAYYFDLVRDAIRPQANTIRFFGHSVRPVSK